MKHNTLLKLLLATIVSLSLSNVLAREQVPDENLWLEDIDGVQAMNWVNKTNAMTDKTLGTDPLYREIYQQTLETLDKKDKLPVISQKADWIYQYHKDADNPRGLYRRSSSDSFKSGKPKWQTVLDIDQMSADDGINWVFAGMDCLEPDKVKCLISLSPGGGDAHELREFDTQTLKFIDDGFRLPKAKMQVSWMDEDHLFVGTNFGEGSMTDSGYPRITKIWRRGTALTEAAKINEANQESVITYAYRLNTADSFIDLVVESLSYWTRHYQQLIDGKLIKLALPQTAVINDAFNGQLVVSLKEDWQFAGELYSQGSVLLVKPTALWPDADKTIKQPVTLLVESRTDAIVDDVTVTKKGLVVVVLEDVKSQLYYYRLGKDGWKANAVDLPKSGQIAVQTSNSDTGEFFVRYEGFITPPTLYAVNESLQVKQVLQQSATFDGSGFKVEQYFTNSKDGTRVPYFAVMHKDTKFDGKNPTHIFAYGGFRASLTPAYSGSYEDHNGAYGKAWLERGGVFVLANIRGGGEYGPAWHSAALLKNRHKSFEDFEAVAEDLAKRNITSAKHLGIEGRSNGGLLVTATMIRRPELYGAIICGVPLADMQRYHKLLAGASWMAEYGNPDTQDWQFIKDYSPYQNLNAEQQYPPVFFFGSTRDDRVHPAHARKMAARMIKQGHSVDYFENTEGGHKGSATNEQTARRIALGFTHLWRHLKDDSDTDS